MNDDFYDFVIRSNTANKTKFSDGSVWLSFAGCLKPYNMEVTITFEILGIDEPVKTVSLLYVLNKMKHIWSTTTADDIISKDWIMYRKSLWLPTLAADCATREL